MPEKQVAIIGGGITGLAAAYALQEQARADGLAVSFALFEKSERLGGKILTDHPDGFVVEGGPDSFLGQKPWAADLAKRLGLEQDLIGANPRQKKLYVVHNGRLTPMPEGVMLVIPTRLMPFATSSLISWPGKLRMGLDLLIPPRVDDADESLSSFIRRRLGNEALEKIAAPLMSGIHVSDPERQSILATFPRFRAIEKQHGSLIRGMLAQRRAARTAAGANGNGNMQTPAWKRSTFVSLRGGMEQLVSALENALTGGEIRTGCGVTDVMPYENRFRVETEDGQSMLADAVILAAPAYVSARLVAGFAPELSTALSGIRYVSTATVSLAFDQPDLSRMQDGTGFIIPRGENRRITACTASSVKFPGRAPGDHALLRCFMGGPGNEQAVEQSDAELIAAARSELAGLLGITAEPVFARVYRWMKGNPQYDVGHLERVRHMHALAARVPGLYLGGAAFNGVGIPDCIRQGQQAAEKTLAFLARS